MKEGNFIEHINKESKSGYSHDDKYIIVSYNCRLKNPDTGKWYDAVLYKKVLNLDHTIFAREKESFEKEFKEVDLSKEDIKQIFLE